MAFDRRSGVMYFTLGRAATRFSVVPEMLYRAELINGSCPSSVAPSDVTEFSRLPVRVWSNCTMTFTFARERVYDWRSGEILALEPNARAPLRIKINASRSGFIIVNRIATSDCGSTFQNG